MNESNTKLAFKYLDACDATAICLINRNGSYDVTVSRSAAKSQGPDVIVYWIGRGLAAAVARQARHNAGEKPNVEVITRELYAAAASHHATLTPHVIALHRANALADKLKSRLRHLRGTGALRDFNAEYRRRRATAESNGQGFMTYAAAESRLQRAIIARLVNGNENGKSEIKAIFHEVFGNDERRTTTPAI